MIQLSDEILNKYIDGELEQSMLVEIREQLKDSEKDRRRLAALQTVHRELANLKSYEVSNDFTAKIMFKLRKNVMVTKKDRYFIFSVSSIFIIISLIIIGYMLAWTVSQNSGPNSLTNNIDNYANYFVNVFSSIKSFLTAKNISIIGSIFSFGIIISGYIFFENLRQTKRRLSKLH